MGVVTDRRQFMKTALYGAAGAALTPALSSVAHAADAKIEVTNLGSGLHVLHVLPDATATVASGAGMNIAALRDANGWVLVDGGLEEHSPAILATLSALGSGPVHTVYNTNWRPETRGLNLRLGETGGRIISTALTRQWMSRSNYIEWEAKSYERMPTAGLPNDFFYYMQTHLPRVGEHQYGSEHAEYGYLQAAFTDGDLYVYFKDSNVLVTGSTMTVGSYPLSDYVTGGWMHDMRDAAEWLMKITNADTRIIARSGPVQTRADLELQYNMLDVMCTRLMDNVRSAAGLPGNGNNRYVTPQVLLDRAITADFDARWGDPRQFIYNAYWGMIANSREVIPSFA